MDLERVDGGAIVAALRSSEASMDYDYTTILASELAIGDSIIGADDREYLIETIEVDDVLQEYVVWCVNEKGQAVKANLPLNASVQSVYKRIDLIKGDTFGMKLCDNCGHTRSKSRNWSYDDYVCKVCREALDSQT